MHEGNHVLNIKIGGNGASTARLYILEVPVSVTLRALLAKLSNCLETVIFGV